MGLAVKSAWLESNMNVEVCRFCGARPEECGGKCVSFTNQTLLGRPIVEADIGMGDVKEIVFAPPAIKVRARIVSQQDNGDGTWTIGVVYEEDQPCPQKHQGNAHE